MRSSAEAWMGPRLRVADKVLQSFHYACTMQDFDVAERLLGILEHMDTRPARRFGGERRGSGIDLVAARAHLLRCKAGAAESRKHPAY